MSKTTIDLISPACTSARTSVCGVIAMCLMFASLGCQSSQSRVATFGNQFFFDYYGRQSVDSRVNESGLSVTLKLEISGCSGLRVPVQLYAKNSAGYESFLAQNIVTPPSGKSVWNEFCIFVPLSRLAGIQSVTELIVYVQSPDNSNEYIGKARCMLNPPYRPDCVWSWQELKDDVPMPLGDLALCVKTKVDLSGFRDEDLEAVIILEDAKGHTLTSASGDPLIIPGPKIYFEYDYGQWYDLNLYVPYEQLSNLWPGLMVFARPAIRRDNGDLIGGNIYVKFWAGGSLETLHDRFKAESDQIGQEIMHLETRLKAFEQESSP